MANATSIPSTSLQVNDELHGFRVQSVTPVPGIRANAIQLEHIKSGARLLHIHAADEENLLAIAFRTPPSDDTGLPHILEHTVLCGSKKYPVKDPFVELVKTSLATFLNAMTYSDKTVYPCASMVEKDFYNLAGVYCDAVFHPIISEKHFKQEGHHLDFAEPGNTESDLIVKGIVYNEMKGVYSDLDSITFKHITEDLCPDNTYGHDSGGDPDYIPDLTYEQFVDFHKTYYHPSNSLIFLFGDIPTEKHLAFLDQACLDAFDRIEIDTTIAPQPRWSEPKKATVPYPFGPDDDPKDKCAVTVSFLTNEQTDVVRSLSMDILGLYLLHNAASPLRKALIDSKLGDELTSSGYFDGQRDTLFTVGMKGTSEDRADKIAQLILDVCRREAENGLDKDKVSAAFHRFEMSTREIQGMYPLKLMGQVYMSWLYDADPLYHLRLDEHLATLHQRYESEEGFFENTLRELVVENPHYVIHTFAPDQTYVSRREEAFRNTMAERKATLSQDQLNEIAREAAELDAMQSKPNPPEALATLPRLSLSDVSSEPVKLPVEVDQASGCPLLRSDVFANGMNYLHLAVDLSGIDDDLIDYLPLFTDILRKMGAGGDDFVVTAEREAACTGGIGANLSATGRIEDPTHVQPFLYVSSKALDAKLNDMLGLLTDRLFKSDLTDVNRFRDVLMQGRVSRNSNIIPAGSQYAALYAARQLSRNGAINERIGGITQVKMFNAWANDFDTHCNELIEKLGRIQSFIANRQRITTSFVGGDAQFDATRSYLASTFATLNDSPFGEESSSFTRTLNTREGIASASEVAFVARAFPSIGLDHDLAPAMMLLGSHLSYAYLWEEVRVKGGAYGSHARYNGANGLFNFTSYRDPNVTKTLDAYAGIGNYVNERMDLSDEAIEQAIIGTIKSLDQPIRPSQAVGTALARHLKHETDEFRKAFRSRLMALTKNDILSSVNDVILPAFATSPICVLSSREKLENANTELGDRPLKITDLNS